MANDNQLAVKKRLIYAEDLFEPVDVNILVVSKGGRSGGKTMAMYEEIFRKRVELAPTIDALPLRCHMGDTVWIVGTKCLSGLYESECRVSENVCDICQLDREFIAFPRSVYGSLFLAIHELEHNPLFRWGETVFKTQEEAEAALAKMKEADHVV